MESLNIFLYKIMNTPTSDHNTIAEIMLFIATQVNSIIYALLILLVLKERSSFFSVFLKIIFSLIAAFTFSYITSLFYFHPRPFMIALGHTLVKHQSTTSFPSHHALALFTIGFTLLFNNSKKLGILILTTGILVGFARIYIGVHFPFDILGSFIIAIIASLLIEKTSSNLPLKAYLKLDARSE